MENIEPSRKIIISSHIDSNIAGEVMARIIEINEYDNAMSVLSTYEPDPIEIFINSGGGSALDGFAIVDAMEMSETPIITYGFGTVASMALAIFLAGDIRISARHTRFMYHSVYYEAFGALKDHEDAKTEAEYLMKMYDDIVLDKTKISEKDLQDVRIRKQNFYFSPRQAKNLGVVDVILTKPNRNIKLIEEE